MEQSKFCDKTLASLSPHKPNNQNSKKIPIFTPKKMTTSFIIIAGPCSVESEEQISATAAELQSLVKPAFFRAGVWKPRTRPDSFEGIGDVGLKWLKNVQDKYNIPVITEVGSAEHINKVLDHGIKSVWIGARTVANPFSVQEIANAAHNNNMNIFIKNPIYPDIELWIGAIERFLKIKSNKVFAIHRGFFPFGKSNLRNVPQWEIPIELVRRIPDIKIICDPSHISGHKKYVKEISQKAIDLNMQGLMIESHYKPEIALSDKNQQLTPQDLKKILDQLNFRKSQTEDRDFLTALENLREKIDVIDLQLIDMLQHRFKLVDEIGKLKKENDIVILQIERWKKIIETRIQYSDPKSISRKFLLQLLQMIHKESIKRQNLIINPGQNKTDENSDSPKK